MEENKKYILVDSTNPLEFSEHINNLLKTYECTFIGGISTCIANNTMVRYSQALLIEPKILR